ncbi:MAG: hypothetical protein EHM45_05835 [Desulfobacteraceae bacterium]|nr:MAG: hypothetical protein EHM45_05835 [Desulfobacteraceae bacterium]
MSNSENANIIPTLPCPHCGTADYNMIDNLWMELISESKLDPGHVIKFGFTARVCAGCGATTFFSRNAKGGFTDTIHRRGNG